MKRLLYLDCLRILAAFGVVLLHVACEGYSCYGVSTIEWHFLNMCNGLVRWSVPVFVMISGAIFLDTERGVTLRDIYLKHGLKIVIIIGLWEIADFMLLLVKSLYRNGVTFDSVWVSFRALQYPPGISWFLFMLLGLYALVPVLKLVAHDKRALLYIMCLSFGLNAMTAFSDLLVHGDWVMKTIKLCGFDSFLGFVGYFCAGVYFKLYFDNRSAQIAVYWLGGMGALITVLGSSCLSLVYQRPMNNFYYFLSPNVAFMTFALFCLLKSCDMKNVSAKMLQVIFDVSRATLLIYFLHYYVIVGFRAAFGLSVIKIHVGFAPLIAVIVFCVSLGLAMVLLRNRRIRRIF